MTVIRFLDAATYFKGKSYQVEAWNYLQNNVPQKVLEEFAAKYRQPDLDNIVIPQSGIALIKEFEGCSLKAYYDPLTGNLPITIGYGSTRRLDGSVFMIGTVISQQEAETLLADQLKKNYLPQLSKIPYWNEMTEEMQGALLSFAYNLGANFYGSSGFNTITEALKTKNWQRVSNALLLYVNPGTNVTQGLTRRRKAEGSLWNLGLSKLSLK